LGRLSAQNSMSLNGIRILLAQKWNSYFLQHEIAQKEPKRDTDHWLSSKRHWEQGSATSRASLPTKKVVTAGKHRVASWCWKPVRSGTVHRCVCCVAFWLKGSSPTSPDCLVNYTLSSATASRFGELTFLSIRWRTLGHPSKKKIDMWSFREK
jgi:hypothetical protein